jgi:hypothetical protein
MSLADLGRRAVACKHWRWMPGMMLQWKTVKGSHYRGRVCDTWSFEDEGALYCEGHEDRFTREELKAAWPDLSDPATLGCLLHLVREAWEVERAVVWWNEHDQGWVADVRPRNFVFVRDSEAHALVAALETAP